MNLIADQILGAAVDANLYAARYQMAISLGFHIILAAFGVAYPLITFIAHRRGFAKDDFDALRLAKRWSKAMAVLCQARFSALKWGCSGLASWDPSAMS